MGLAVGIDLGTSNSCIACVRDGQVIVCLDSEGRNTQPSVVAFGSRSVVVGARAKKQMLHSPEGTVMSAKRLIGRRFEDAEVQRMKSRSSFGVYRGDEGDARFRVHGKGYAPEEISAHVLAHMKRIAEAQLGEVVDKAVITVPAYFNDAQRQATRDAAQIAGLECLRVLNEPTAAALAYGYNNAQKKRVVVFDLGGGTFDVSILRVDGDLYEVIATAGDTLLGGDDFDNLAVDELLRIFEAQVKQTFADNRTIRMRLREAAEMAKIALSKSEEVMIDLPGVWRNAQGQDFSFSYQLDRHTYARWVLPLVQRTLGICEETLKTAKMNTRHIDAVLLVGGMTRYPLVREAAQHLFGRMPDTSVNPDEAVAVGAAIQAHMLTATDDSMPASVLLDVTSHSLSIRTMGGHCDVVIPANTPIPTEASKVFNTAVDQQAEVRIAVFQGEGRTSEMNDLLGQFVLAVPPMPRGQVRVRVTFTIDSDGIVHVRAVDDKLAKEASIRIEARGGMTPEEVRNAQFNSGEVVGNNPEQPRGR